MGYSAGIYRTEGDFIVPAARRCELLAALHALGYVTGWGPHDPYTDPAVVLRDYGFDVDGNYPDDEAGTDTALLIEGFAYDKLGSDFDELIDVLARFAPTDQRVEWYWEGDNDAWWVNRFEHGTHTELATRVVIDDGLPAMTAELADALDTWRTLYHDAAGHDVESAALHAAADHLAALWDNAHPQPRP